MGECATQSDPWGYGQAHAFGSSEGIADVAYIHSGRLRCLQKRCTSKAELAMFRAKSTAVLERIEDRSASCSQEEVAKRHKDLLLAACTSHIHTPGFSGATARSTPKILALELKALQTRRPGL